jgi:hypothetical protein
LLHRETLFCFWIQLLLPRVPIHAQAAKKEGVLSDWWDENGLGFLAGDDPGNQNYPGGSATFNENAGYTGPDIAGGGYTGLAPQPQTWPAQSAPAAAPSAGGGDYRSQVEAIMGGANALDPSKIAALEAAGFKVTPPNASGERSKIQLPTGEWVRIIGAGEGHPVWIPQGGAGTSYSTSGPAGAAGGGGGIAQGGMGATAEELASYGVPGNQYASRPYGGGYTPPVWGNQFTAPVLSESNDPGLEARFRFGQQALERSAAAKGTILNGGTQQATAMFGQDYGSNEYANVFDRAFKQYQQKYGEFQDAANLGLRAEQNQYGEYLGEQNRTLSDYLTNYNIGRTGVQDFLNQQNKTADRGLNATLGGRP